MVLNSFLVISSFLLHKFYKYPFLSPPKAHISGFIKNDNTFPFLAYEGISPFLSTEFTTIEFIESAGAPILTALGLEFEIFVPETINTILYLFCSSSNAAASGEIVYN